MPTYEYRCKKCKHEFEKVQRITEEPVKKCPTCKGAVERLVSGRAFMLKGSGWYKDGYASSKSGSKKGSAEKPKREEKKTEKNT